MANDVEIEDCKAGIWDWKLAERFASPSAICNLQFLFFNLPFPWPGAGWVAGEARLVASSINNRYEKQEVVSPEA